MKKSMDERTSAKILAVDDTKLNIDIIVNALQDLYDLRVAMKGSDTLLLIKEELPDLILLDINMPEMDGFELGGVDYIVKPYNVVEIKSRINTQLEIKFSRELLSNKNSNLTKNGQYKNGGSPAAAVCHYPPPASLAETRDDDKGHHIIRTQQYVKIMLQHMKHLSQYRAILTEELTETIIMATPLHDIGKIGIPDAILLKPGKLTADELEIMKQHTHMGMKAMRVAQEAISLSARLVVIADFMMPSFQIAFIKRL